MAEPIDAGDRRILIAAAAVMAVLLVLTYAFAPAQRRDSIGYPSSYSSDWAGAKGAFLLLRQMGYDVRRWESSPQQLPTDASGTLLVLAEPFEGGTPEEQAEIRAFVTGGGRLLALGASAAPLTPDAKAIAIPDWHLESKPFTALVPSPLTRNAPQITMVAPDRWTSTQLAPVGLYGTDEQPVAVVYKVGRGEVIWWASASPLWNGIIRQSGNLAFFLNSVGPVGTHVLWDEYFHGSHGSLLDYFLATPLPWATAQLGLLLLVAIFTFSRRYGPVWVPAGESRLSPLEFVDTLGDLYKTAHASPSAVGVAYQRLRFALSRKIGVSSKAKLAELSRAASVRFGWPEAPLLEALSQAERAMRSLDLDDRTALALVRDLHQYSVRLELQGRTSQEMTAWK